MLLENFKPRLSFLCPSYLFGLVWLILPVHCFCQDDGTPFFEMNFQRFSLREFDLRYAEENIRTRMLCEDWCDEIIITMVDTLETKFNLDLYEFVYFINMNDKVFSIKSDFIKSFILNGKTFVNYKDTHSGEPLLLEEVVAGNYVLYKKHGINYRKPDFDPILNVGNREGSYKRTYDYFAYCNERLISIPSKVKKALKKMNQECGTPKGLNVKGELEDLFKLLNNLNE